MAKLVTGVFATRSSSMQAVEDLMRHGIPQEDISLQGTDSMIGREFYTRMASKAPEGGVFGTILGGILGAIVTGLIATGYVNDPGMGIAGMNIVLAVLVGIGAGMIVGLLVGAVIGSGYPEYESMFGQVGEDRRVGILVGVYSHERRATEIKHLMQASGARELRVNNVRTEPLRIHTGREYVGVDNDIDRFPPRNAA